MLVNSQFTAGVFDATFTRLAARGVKPDVLYPAVPVPPAKALDEAAQGWRKALGTELTQFVEQGGPMVLSINR